MSKHFAQEIIPLTSILSHKGRGGKVNDWRWRSARGEEVRAMTGDGDLQGDEEVRLGNDWRWRSLKEMRK